MNDAALLREKAATLTQMLTRRHLVAYDSEETQSTDQVGTLSKAGRIMSAPFGRRDIHGRMLLCEIAVGQAWSGRWPHINSTSVRS